MKMRMSSKTVVAFQQLLVQIDFLVMKMSMNPQTNEIVKRISPRVLRLILVIKA